jgi:hypothetical protein
LTKDSRQLTKDSRQLTKDSRQSPKDSRQSTKEGDIFGAKLVFYTVLKQIMNGELFSPVGDAHQ